MNRNDIRVGMIVDVSAPGYTDRPWKVVKINPRSIGLQDESGRSLRADAFYLTPSDATFTAGARERFVIGQVVKFHGGDFVVIKTGTGDTYNLAKLGGDAGRYYRSIPATAMAAV